MELFKRNNKTMGYHLIITISLFLLLCSGCTNQEESSQGDIGQEQGGEESIWKPSYELTEETLLSWDYAREAETGSYQIDNWGRITFSERKEMFYDWKFWDVLEEQIFHEPLSYQILYADEYYLCVYRQIFYSNDDGYTSMEPSIFTICLQNPVYEVGNAGNDGNVDERMPTLYTIQEDIDYPDGFWPGNGINISLNKILQEIEEGNCYMDKAGYELYQKSPELFIESVRQQFWRIKETGFMGSYEVRFGLNRTETALRMYIREGRVGFFIRLKDGERIQDKNAYPMPIDFSYDFRIEVAYDWKQDASIYHMPYELYSFTYEDEICGEVLYPQIRGIDQVIADKLNRMIKENLENNLKTIDVEKTNEIISEYHDIPLWEGGPRIGPPRILFRSERYLCIRQEPLLTERATLRYIEGWRRDFVYDLKTGECLTLGDIIRLDEEFVSWLKEPETVKKVEGGEWSGEGNPVEGIPNTAADELGYYQEDFLLEQLEKAEFYMKAGQLFIRLPYATKEGNAYRYIGERQTGPNWRGYFSCRIALEDLREYLKTKPW